jgi:hypothetical protein
MSFRHALRPAFFTLALASTLAAPWAAQAAPKEFILKDQSMESLVDSKAAVAIMAAAIPGDRMHKVYNNLRWGFASQVEGGVTQAGVCVVTARVMLLPATVGKNLVFNPKSKITVFDAAPGLTREKCAELATAKLKEATQSMVSSLLK